LHHQLLTNNQAWLTSLANADNPLEFTLFGYDAVGSDWAFRQRVLPDHLMYLVTDGACVGDIEDTSISLSAGSFLWMRPGVRHTFSVGRTSQPLTLYFTRFRLGGRDQEFGLLNHVAQQWHGAWDLLELMDQLVDELGTRLPFRQVRLRALLLSICASSLRRGEIDMADAGAGTLSRPQRQAIEAYVRENLAARPSPRDLADHIRLSHDYFSRLFTQTFGMPPRAWLVQERLRRGARSLADSVQNISEVANSLGYSDVGAFSHQFKQRYGMSPRAYRRMQR